MPLSRFGRRKKHTFGKKKEKWDGDFRKPPKPDSYYVQEKGTCRWCGKKIIENKIHNTRKSWHQDCATDYMIIFIQRKLENIYGNETKEGVMIVENNVHGVLGIWIILNHC